MKGSVIPIFCVASLAVLVPQARDSEPMAEQPATPSENISQPVAKADNERLRSLLTAMEEIVEDNRLHRGEAPDPYPCDLIAQ